MLLVRDPSSVALQLLAGCLHVPQAAPAGMLLMSKLLVLWHGMQTAPSDQTQKTAKLKPPGMQQGSTKCLLSPRSVRAA